MIAPTIIIGLGGIGSEICCRVSKLVKEDEKRKRIRFVCIDTDVNDLNRRRDEDPRVITIQTSVPYKIGDYLRTNPIAKEEWFPIHNILMGKTPTEGAGQVRAISRLAFEEALREGKMDELEKTIEELYYLDGESSAQAIRVVIVSTLAGGTGSGIVLPVALYVRHFLETRFRKNASVVRGFFLLPEIMFKNKAPEERASLCCNAYASLRELDSFMRRGDGALPMPKYKNLEMKLPDPSSDSYVDYRESPFNFCFLYDKRNTDDLQLSSFDDYKEHAANTIYAQAVSGMSNRSNSNEDNTIKGIVASNGRNRFCGAGSSLLKYPRDSVLRYVADKWCVENMDEDWLRSDKKYFEYQKEQKRLRRTNPNLEEKKLSEFYIDGIDNGEKGSFEETIFRMCHVERQDKNGKEVQICKADLYTEALSKYLKETIEKNKEVLEADSKYKKQFDKVNKFVNPETKDDKSIIEKDDVIPAFRNLGRSGADYVNTVRRVAINVGRTLAMQLFNDDRDFTSDNASYRMESFMRDEDNRFIHPNAARYFIYSLSKSFLKGKNESDIQLKQLEKLVNPFDDETTPNTKETYETFISKNLGTKFMGMTTDGARRKECVETLSQQHEDAIKYALEIARKIVFELGEEYLNELSKAYESFYLNFSSYLKETENEIADIERRFVNGEGKATRYVCASKTCLEEMLERMPCSSDSSNVNGKLSASIFQEMKSYAIMVRKPNASNYFSELFEKSIMDFWMKSVENQYAEEINMDIIEALEYEAEYEKHTTLRQDEKLKYVERVLNEAERLAAPFIEEPMGEPRHPFVICAYHSSVEGEAGSTRRQFVNEKLRDRLGGLPDDNVSKYELMIYKAIYNMSAGDLMRFRAPEPDMDNPSQSKDAGVYYKAYMDLIERLVIRKLKPESKENDVLTPHLDIKWHLPKYLPDLDDRNQRILENKIYKALAWGMITGEIEQVESRGDFSASISKLNISYRPVNGDYETFLVSNRTPCDDLYEVVDALSINLPLVGKIVEDFDKTIKRERQDGLVLSQTRLMNSLNWIDPKTVFGDSYDPADRQQQNANIFEIKQFAPKQAASIFDLLFWVWVSTPADDITLHEIGIILDGMLSMIEEYVKNFEGSGRCYNICYNILVDQFTQFLDNLAKITEKKARNRIDDECVCLIRDRLDERIEDLYQMESRKLKVMRRIHSQKKTAFDANSAQ